MTWAYRVCEYGYHIYFLILLAISFVAQFTKLLKCEINNLWCLSGCSVFEYIQSLSQTSWLLYFSNRDILKGCSCHVFLEICVIFFKIIYLPVNLWIEASFMKAVNQTAGQCWGIFYPFSFVKVMEERVYRTRILRVVG